MASFFRINADIKNTIAINNEKETVHMTLQNFLDEAWRVIHVEKDSPTTGFDKVVLLNKKDSKLLPFTIILADPNGKKYADTAQTNIYNLLIKNVAYTYTGISVNGSYWQLLDKMLPRCDSTKKYCLDYWNNAVYYYPSGAQTSGGALDWSFCVNTPYPTGCVDHFCKDDTDTQCIKKPYIDPDPTKTDYCGKIGLDSTKACILAGYKQNSLTPNTVAFAPFIKILRPTDLNITTCIKPTGETDFNGNCLFILSPYEQLQYEIDVNTNKIASIPTSYLFPYYYSGTVIKNWILKDATLAWQIQPENKNFTINAANPILSPLPTFTTSDIRNSFGLQTFKYIKSVYGTPVLESSKDSIDQIQYTLVDPMYTKDGKSGNQNPSTDTTKQSSSFLFKTSKIN
jgi:hypothetical protein